MKTHALCPFVGSKHFGESRAFYRELVRLARSFGSLSLKDYSANLAVVPLGYREVLWLSAGYFAV